MAIVKRKCDHCGDYYDADTRNLKRGWGLCCNKSCAAKKREQNKPNYDSKRVARNNIRRENWNNKNIEQSTEDFYDKCFEESIVSVFDDPYYSGGE